MPNDTPRPPLNQLRALLLVAIGRYLDRARLQEVRDGISELEIQKLAYFLKVLGSPYPLTFARGYYGPYAEQLCHVLDRVEGHYLVGLGDHSARVTDLTPTNLTPTNLTPGSRENAAAVLAGFPDDERRVDELIELVDGFETPYSLELLATVHYAAGQDPVTADVDEMSRRVAAWNLRRRLGSSPTTTCRSLPSVDGRGLARALRDPLREKYFLGHRITPWTVSDHLVAVGRDAGVRALTSSIDGGGPVGANLWFGRIRYLMLRRALVGNTLAGWWAGASRRKSLYHRVEKDSDGFGRIFVHFRWR